MNRIIDDIEKVDIVAASPKPVESSVRKTKYPSLLFPDRICTFEKEEKNEKSDEDTGVEKKRKKPVLYIPTYLIKL